MTNFGKLALDEYADSFEHVNRQIWACYPLDLSNLSGHSAVSKLLDYTDNSTS